MPDDCEYLGLAQPGVGLPPGAGKPIYGKKLADFQKKGDISDGDEAARLARRIGRQTKNSTDWYGAGVDKKAVRKTMMNFKATQSNEGDVSCSDDGVYELCKKAGDPPKQF